MTEAGAEQASRLRRRTCIGVVWLVLIGAWIAMGSGNFIFFYGRQYGVAALLAALMLFPYFYWWLTRQGAKQRNRKPIGRLRRLVLYSFGAAMATLMCALAPVGWLLAATWAFGETRASIPAAVLHAGDYHRGRGCNQEGVIGWEGQTASLCLQGLAPLPLRDRQIVPVRVTQSAFGLLIRHDSVR